MHGDCQGHACHADHTPGLDAWSTGARGQIHGYHGGNLLRFRDAAIRRGPGKLTSQPGRLGFRSAKRHAAVAYLCSRVATRSLCEAMDPSFSWDVAVASGGGISEAVGLCNQHLPADSALDVNTLTVLCASQRALSRRVDEWTKAQLLSSGLANAAERARVQAAGAAHSGAWLTALPSPSLEQRMTHPEFVTAAKVRLGLELLTADTWCPLCDEILDTRASHAMACMSGGGRCQAPQRASRCSLCEVHGCWNPGPQGAGRTTPR